MNTEMKKLLTRGSKTHTDYQRGFSIRVSSENYSELARFRHKNTTTQQTLAAVGLLQLIEKILAQNYFGAS